MAYAHFDCPNCKEEREVEVELPRYVWGLDKPCDECEYVLTEEQHDKLYMDFLADGWASMVDEAMMRIE